LSPAYELGRGNRGLKVSLPPMNFVLKAFLPHIKFLGPLENFHKSDGNFLFI